MPTAPIRRISAAEYLYFERQAERKSEFCNGEIIAMAGATREHNLIVTNLASELSRQLKDKPCEVYSCDMRTRIPDVPYVYPDIVIDFSEPQFEDKGLDTLTNPLVVFGVLSDSTADFDRGATFRYYRRIESLREFFVIDQTEPHIERHFRGTGAIWRREEIVGLSAVPTI